MDIELLIKGLGILFFFGLFYLLLTCLLVGLCDLVGDRLNNVRNFIVELFGVIIKIVLFFIILELISILFYYGLSFFKFNINYMEVIIFISKVLVAFGFWGLISLFIIILMQIMLGMFEEFVDDFNLNYIIDKLLRYFIYSIFISFSIGIGGFLINLVFN